MKLLYPSQRIATVNTTSTVAKKFTSLFTGAKSFLHFSFVLMLSAVLLSSSASAQTVTSDKLDYAPGEIAIITGAGWTGDQFVDLHFEENPFVDHLHDYH